MPASDSGVTVRAFTPADADQVAALANAHVSAVIPGAAISAGALMASLEREPGEFLQDPWVIERVTLVAEQRHRIVAAAHLQRFSGAPETPDGMRDIAGIRWLACWPPASFWPGVEQAGTALLDASLTLLNGWGPRVRFADGSLPVPGVYGIPDQWPHIRSLLHAAGFSSAGRSERILMGAVAGLPDPRRNSAPRGFTLHRSVGHAGTRFSAVDADGRQTGMIELDTVLNTAPGSQFSQGLADIGNLHLAKGHVRTTGEWLMSEVRQWLELGGVTRILAYIAVGEDDAEALQQKFLLGLGFQIITTTVRDLTL